MTTDCLILPNSEVDPEVLSRVADLAVRVAYPPVDVPWFQLAKGLAEYRCGQYTNAVAWLTKSLAGSADLATDPGRIYVQVQGRAVLAMAQSRLGQATEARAALSEGQLLARQRLPQLDINGLTDYWPDSIYAEVLLREAADRLAHPR
jgi:hypothetical protein